MADEPTIAFLLNTQQWLSTIHPVTKLELLDWVSVSRANFFFDAENSTFVLLLKQSAWELLDDSSKDRFKLVSRRVREEMDGPFTDDQRKHFETVDPFDVFKKQPSSSLPETIPEETNEELKDADE